MKIEPYADLRDADLRDANLQRADLQGAHLQRAHLQGAYLQGALNLICLDLHDPRGYRPVAVLHDTGYWIAAGCRWYSIDDALIHWRDKTHNAPEIAARYIQEISKLEQI